MVWEGCSLLERRSLRAGIYGIKKSEFRGRRSKSQNAPLPMLWGGLICCGIGEFTSPYGGIKPNLHQTLPPAMHFARDGCRPNLNVAPPSWRLNAGWKPGLPLKLGQHQGWSSPTSLARLGFETASEFGAARGGIPV